MISAVCTLFEGDYHYGLAALCNSLWRHGYRGTVYAGFRGPLPTWAASARRLGDDWILSVAEGLQLHFLPLTTSIHLTNYKAQFMSDLWANRCPEATALFYFDPDIVVLCRWGFFEEWVDAGVAVCQDVNGSMPANHPLRHAWRRSLADAGLARWNACDAYYNGGYVGLHARDRGFLPLWQRVMDHIESAGTSLDSLGIGDRTQPFTCRDQDALNIALMATHCPVSPMGQDAMDFQWGGGGYVMSHALGRRKPWNHCYSWQAIKWIRISRPTCQFLNYLDGPIAPYSRFEQLTKQVDSLAARILGRILA